MSRAPEPHYRPPPIAVRELALDVLMLAAAGLASVAGAGTARFPEVSVGWFAGFSAATLVLLGYFGLYRPRFAPHFLEEVRSIVAATAVAAMAVTFLRVLFADEGQAAGEAVRGWLFAAVYLAAGRGGVQIVQRRARRRGAGGERTLIIGAGQVGHLVAKRLAERPEFGLRPVAFFDPDPLAVEDGAGLPVLGGELRDAAGPRAFAAALEAGVRELGARHVVVAFSLSSHEVELALVRRCQELRVSVSLVPRLFGGLPDQLNLERIGGLPLLTVHPTDPKGWQFAFKYGADRVLAALALVVLSPLLAGTALAIRLTMGRPVLFRQPRVGMDGREFTLLKFRTMRPPSAGAGLPDPGEASIERAPGGVEGEDRRTRVGALLRRTSVDELPQLVNVLRGEMSLIGPRPERTEFARVFDRRVHRYVDRSRVKSGITGWAQVQLPRVRGSVADRAEWDNYYIENWSLWLDFKIALLTVGALFRHRPE